MKRTSSANSSQTSPEDGGSREPSSLPTVPLWLKAPFTIWVLVLIPVWVSELGWANFLWFSDVALFGATLAMWFRLRLLASMMLVGTLLPELAWNVGFFGTLLFGMEEMGLVEYMFDPDKPLYIRFLSLFHVFLLPVMVWLVYLLGYDRRALVWMTLLTWVLLPLTYLLSDREDNINFVFGMGDPAESPIGQPWWLLLLMVVLPVVVFWPTHKLLL